MCALSWSNRTSPQLTWHDPTLVNYMAVCQNLVPLVNIKIAGKWMFIPLNMVLIGIDPYPHWELLGYESFKSWCLTLLPAQHLLWFGNGSLAYICIYRSSMNLWYSTMACWKRRHTNFSLFHKWHRYTCSNWISPFDGRPVRAMSELHVFQHD